MMTAKQKIIGYIAKRDRIEFLAGIIKEKLYQSLSNKPFPEAQIDKKVEVEIIIREV